MVKKPKPPPGRYGYHYGKSDQVRYGLFAEMEYLHGMKYVPPGYANIRDMHNSQMYPGGTKTKVEGLMDGYFDTKFIRVFVEEGWTTQYARDNRERMEAKQLNVSTNPFVPPPGFKLHGCIGDFYGCFEGPILAFSPIVNPPPPREKGVPQILSKPGKKGNGGYTDICLNPYPTYRGTPYDDPKVSAKDIKKAGEKKILPFRAGNYPQNFDKNPYYTSVIRPIYNKQRTVFEPKFGTFLPPPSPKTLGGCKGGGFGKYPKHSDDRWIPPHKVGKPTDPRKAPQPMWGPFWPQVRNKTMPTRSVMRNKVDIALNAKNWSTFRPITYTREFLT